MKDKFPSTELGRELEKFWNTLLPPDWLENKLNPSKTEYGISYG